MHLCRLLRPTTTIATHPIKALKAFALMPKSINMQHSNLDDATTQLCPLIDSHSNASTQLLSLLRTLKPPPSLNDPFTTPTLRFDTAALHHLPFNTPNSTLDSYLHRVTRKLLIELTIEQCGREQLTMSSVIHRLTELYLYCSSVAPHLTVNITLSPLLYCSLHTSPQPSLTLTALPSLPNCVVGGTFDRLHDGHRLLLTAAALCSRTVIVGVTDENMVQKKKLSMLINSCEQRCKSVESFLHTIAPQHDVRAVPISTPQGFAADDESLTAIITSAETSHGAGFINELRRQKQLKPLHHVIVPLIDPTTNQPLCSDVSTSSQVLPAFESKLSSSNARFSELAHYRPQRLLNSFQHQPSWLLNSSDTCAPFVIGLCGGIAAGKSSIARYLQRQHEAHILDCDRIGHQVYQNGTEAFKQIVEVFGEDVVDRESGEINRKALAAKLFNNNTHNNNTNITFHLNNNHNNNSTAPPTNDHSINPQLSRLNSITWPAIAAAVQQQLQQYSADDVVVLDAAVLLEAGWQSLCHEVWVVVVDEDTAIERLQQRNNLSVEEAKRRLSAQMTSSQRLQHADVLLATQFPVEQTQTFVDCAWSELQCRLKWRKWNSGRHSVRQKCLQLMEWIKRRTACRKKQFNTSQSINDNANSTDQHIFYTKLTASPSFSSLQFLLHHYQRFAPYFNDHSFTLASIFFTYTHLDEWQQFAGHMQLTTEFTEAVTHSVQVLQAQTTQQPKQTDSQVKQADLSMASDTLLLLLIVDIMKQCPTHKI